MPRRRGPAAQSARARGPSRAGRRRRQRPGVRASRGRRGRSGPGRPVDVIGPESPAPAGHAASGVTPRHVIYGGTPGFVISTARFAAGCAPGGDGYPTELALAGWDTDVENDPRRPSLDRSVTPEAGRPAEANLGPALVQHFRTLVDILDTRHPQFQPVPA